MVEIKKTIQDLDKLNKADLLPAGIDPATLPTQEFLDAVERIEGTKNKKQDIVGQPTTPLVQNNPRSVIMEPQVDIPIVLQYKYDGNCSTCHTRVDTLIVTVAKQVVAIAWCGNCKKELQQQKVKALGKE